MGELTRARIALDERGQRLGELEEKTAGMMTSAEAFSKHAHEVSCPRKRRHLQNAATGSISRAALGPESLKYCSPPTQGDF